MKQTKKLKLFIRNVVQTQFPEELIEFDLAADQVIEAKLTGSHIDSGQSDDDNYEFGISVTEVMEFIVLIGGTLEAIKLIYNTINPEKNALEIDSVKDSWKKSLLSEGLSEESASKIVLKFSEDFTKILK
jgi:hypothetical protein